MYYDNNMGKNHGSGSGCGSGSEPLDSGCDTKFEHFSHKLSVRVVTVASLLAVHALHQKLYFVT